MFIMECLCGARYSDCQRMTEENIDDTGHFLALPEDKDRGKGSTSQEAPQVPRMCTGDEPSRVR